MIGKSKVLDYENNWYDEIDGSSFYEKDLENTILMKLPTVYPDYYEIPFKLSITAGEETCIPDLVMVKNDYSEWYIIEVELARHDWNHVEKQVRVFTKGRYEKNRIAKYILQQDTEHSNRNSKSTRFDLAKLKRMVADNQPKVMIIVNESVKEWIPRIKSYNAFLSVFQIYKGLNKHEIYRVEGDVPFVSRDQSHCNFLKGSSNILIVHDSDFIHKTHEEKLEIIYLSKKTKWTVMKEDRKVKLIFNGSTHSLQLEKKYILHLSDSGEYYLEIA